MEVLSEFLEAETIQLDDYACPKVQTLIFKDEEYDWRSSSYPFRHTKILTVQKERHLHMKPGLDVFSTNCEP